jgi:periplasmic protein TonB
MVARTAERRFGALGRMGLVAAVHVAALYLIANSLGIVPGIAIEPRRVVAEFLPDPPRHDDPIPVARDPEITEPEVLVPIPENREFENDTVNDSITARRVELDQIPAGPGSATVVPDNVVGPRSDPRHPLTQPAYPAPYIRGGIEGDVDVEILVQPNGRIGDARIVRSSGHELFDRAALEEARRSWRMLPATRNGEPYAQWYRLRVVFKLKNAQ